MRRTTRVVIFRSRRVSATHSLQRCKAAYVLAFASTRSSCFDKSSSRAFCNSARQRYPRHAAWTAVASARRVERGAYEGGTHLKREEERNRSESISNHESIAGDERCDNPTSDKEGHEREKSHTHVVEIEDVVVAFKHIRIGKLGCTRVDETAIGLWPDGGGGCEGIVWG